MATYIEHQHYEWQNVDRVAKLLNGRASAPREERAVRVVTSQAKRESTVVGVHLDSWVF